MINSLITEKELIKFQEKYQSLLISDISLIDTIIKYLSKKKGKFLRPALAINVGKCLNNLNSKNYTVASLVEMIHLATLIHDDIVDESFLRRGWPTIGRVWKNKIALLIGDYIFSKSLSAIIELDDMESIKILSHTSDRLSKGEILQIQESRKGFLDEAIYYEMIKDKTASLFSAVCELSARSSSDNKEDIQKFKTFGENFGIAYQIKDDVSDISSSSVSLGKPVNLDVKRNIITLPYIFCLNQLKDKDKKQFLYKIKKLSKRREKKEIYKLVEELGGIKYSQRKVKEHLNLCLMAVEGYSNNLPLKKIIEKVFNEK